MVLQTMFFSDVVEAIKGLSTEEKQEIQLQHGLQRSLPNTNRLFTGQADYGQLFHPDSVRGYKS